MPYRYRCEKCGNTVDASRVEKRVPGSINMTRVVPTVECEQCDAVMTGESYTPERREVSREH